MAISVNPATHVVSVPQSYLTLISGSLYELDVNQLRLDLRDWEDGEAGIYHPKTHDHNTALTLSGVTYARALKVLSPYTVEFEDGQYVVRCVGANHNLADVKVANQVSLIIGNAAGLVSSGSGVTAQDKLDIASQSRDAVMGVGIDGGITLEQMLRLLSAVHAGNIVRSGNSYSIRGVNAPTLERIIGTVDASGNRTVTGFDVDP